MTATESTYISSYCNVIRCISDVRAHVTGAHRQQLDTLEADLGEDRCEELREIARRRMGF